MKLQFNWLFFILLSFWPTSGFLPMFYEIKTLKFMKKFIYGIFKPKKIKKNIYRNIHSNSCLICYEKILLNIFFFMNEKNKEKCWIKLFLHISNESVYHQFQQLWNSKKYLNLCFFCFTKIKHKTHLIPCWTFFFFMNEKNKEKCRIKLFLHVWNCGKQ